MQIKTNKIPLRLKPTQDGENFKKIYLPPSAGEDVEQMGIPYAPLVK